MGYNPKRNLDNEIHPKAKQQSLHHPDDHEEFSHLLTPMIIARKENHT